VSTEPGTAGWVLRRIHVCGYCQTVCTGDGTDEHACDNDDCLSIHLPAPETLDRRTARHGGETIDPRRNY